MNTRNSSSLPPVALIAGPTASGKSALALRLAELHGGTVINADASQVYADLRIVSARPSPEEESRAPHRLFGHVDGARACSAAEWAGDARQAISDAHDAGRLPILVGGTGLYLRTLLDGIAPIPPIDPDIREAVRAMTVADAHAALMREDDEAARRLHPADTARVGRALEVIRSTGRTIADWQQDRTGGIGDAILLSPLLLLPPRDWLYDRCDRRFAGMIAGGGMEEVAALLLRNLDPALPVMRAIGVPDIAARLNGHVDHATMLSRAAQATRRFAKRQYTWFLNQPPAYWPRLTVKLDDECAANDATRFLNSTLTR